jgi:peptide/nickel transport system substrate-binding protein
MRALGPASAVVAVLLALLCASGSSAASARGSATLPLLRIGTTLTFGTLDPSRVYGNFWGGVQGLERLLKFGPDGNLEPNLAQSISQPGKAVYVYHLRHGVRFWDGNELTSADVANAINYQRYPGATTSTNYPSVKSVSATDRYTVVVTLKHPDASWREKLAIGGWIFEKKFQDAHKSTMGQPGTLIQGTGPWEVASWDPASDMEMTANPHWWGGTVPIQRLSIKLFADENSEALAFRAGAIDVAFPSDGRAFAATAGTKLLSAATSDMASMVMNVRVPPFNDVHVRRAVAYALDRTAIISSVGGYAAPITTIILPSQLRLLGSKAQVDRLIASLPQYPYDVARAKAELAKSAYPNGFSATVPILSFYPPLVNGAQVMAAELAKIGITMKPVADTLGEWLQQLKDKNYEFFFAPSGSNDPDPSIWPAYNLGSRSLSPGGGNFANYAPPAVDVLIKQALEALDPQKRLAIYGKLLRRVALDAPYVALYSAAEPIALSSKFAWPGFVPNFTRVDDLWPLQIRAG